MNSEIFVKLVSGVIAVKFLCSGIISVHSCLVRMT